MGKKSFDFKQIEPWPGVELSDWRSWKWQMQKALKSLDQFAQLLKLTPSEVQGFAGKEKIFRVQTTPYYGSLMMTGGHENPIRQMVIPRKDELEAGSQQMLDPLGENQSKNRATQRLIHRYTDRALFLVTDMCGVYCRYCTRKHFTASDQVVATEVQIKEAVQYLKKNSQIKEVILSGGDPLTISNSKLAKIIEEIYSIDSVELIRIGSRMPVACPMRIDDELIDIFKEFKPIYMMTHFNHPDELTSEAAEALEKLVDNGVPVFNQLVLLNGINNDASLIYALSRRLLSLRVKPYYMFQADPSLGTDHLRNSIEDSLEIQRQLWGHASGLAMPNYVVDIPEGGGKTQMAPNFETHQKGQKRTFCGWDNVKADYISPVQSLVRKPLVQEVYQKEWINKL